MKKKFFVGSIFILVLLIITFIYFYSKDNYRFKIEYEIYNNIEFDNGKKIKVSIPSKNKIKYVSEKELEDILTKETGIVYFGYPTCQWCRNIVSILTNIANESTIDTLYYVDVAHVKTEGVKEILSEYLREDGDGNKHLYVPDIYFIKNGKILDHHIGTVESYKNAFLGMNEEQKQELEEIYKNGIQKIVGE